MGTRGRERKAHSRFERFNVRIRARSMMLRVAVLCLVVISLASAKPHRRPKRESPPIFQLGPQIQPAIVDPAVLPKPKPKSSVINFAFKLSPTKYAKGLIVPTYAKGLILPGGVTPEEGYLPDERGAFVGMNAGPEP